MTPDPRTLLDTARGLYERGLSPSQVMTEIYGVDLPAEAKLVLRDYIASTAAHVDVQWSILPWDLYSPPSQGAEIPISDLEAARVVQASAIAPRLLLLGVTSFGDSTYSGFAIGYDLDALRTGDTTVYGIRVPITEASRCVQLGSSLLDVLREGVSSYVDALEIDAEEGNRYVGQRDIELARSQLPHLEELVRELGGTVE